jgi:PAS domain S-box-containing protein
MIVASLLPSALSASPLAVVALREDGCILEANAAFCRLVAMEPCDLTGRDALQFVHRSEREAARAALESVADGTEPHHIAERRYHRQDGSQGWMHVALSRAPDPAPRERWCLAILHDVTDRRRALETAARTAAQLSAVIQAIPDAVYIGDASGIKIVNPAGLQQLGFGAAEELDRDLPDLSTRLENRWTATGERVEPDEEPFAQALRGDSVVAEVTSRNLRTGEPVVQRVVAAPVMFDGRVIGAVAVNTDITAQRRMLQALRYSEERFRALFEQAAVGIQIMDPGGRIVNVNRAWEELWGVPLQAVARYSPLADGQLEAKGVMEHVRRAFAGETVAIPPVLYRPTDTLPELEGARDRWVSAVAYPMKDDHGRVREVVLIFHDVSEVVAARYEAEAANRVKDDFLATLSHELRTPITAILGWAHMLERHAVDPRLRQGLAVITRNAQAQSRLVEDLLDVSRIITGKLGLDLETLDLEQVVRDALESLAPTAAARSLRLDVSLQPVPPLRGDRRRLAQIVWNLANNAVKFTDPGGAVRVSLAHQDGRAVLEVRDTGQGIDVDLLPYIFDRFRQADASATRRHAGLGLGLAIVRYVTELHHGTVHADSPGRGMGATFRVELPLSGVQAE